MNFKKWMQSIWDSEIIYDEFFTMVEENGVCKAPFLFEPAEILSVTSADKSATYEENIDWVLEGNYLRLPPYSRIFHFHEQEMVSEQEIPNMCFQRKDGKYSLFSEGHFFHDHQISVTYRKKSGSLNIHPEFSKGKLPRTFAKLENGEFPKIVLFGDSISCGANSSGVMQAPPYVPCWATLVMQSLERHYKTGIEFLNTSWGGIDSFKGVEWAHQHVAVHKPDLVIIAFGMNDGVPGPEFLKNIQKIMEITKQESPDTEFILCATMLPNRELKGFFQHQDEYGTQLRTLEGPGIAVADFGAMQAELLKTKRFVDLTGNNVNHVNDFMARCHAQLLAGMLIQEQLF